MEPIVFAADMDLAMTRANTTMDNIWAGGTKVALLDNGKDRVLPYHTDKKANSTDGSSVRLWPDDATTDGTFFWATLSETRTFSAWYPYSDTQPTSAIVDQDQSAMEPEAYLAQDLLYAPAITMQYKQKMGHLTFYHQLCRVLVSVNSVATANTVTEITLGNSNIGLSADVEMGVTGEGTGSPLAKWEAISDPSNTVTMRKNTELSDEANFNATYECLLPPQAGGNFVDPLFTIQAWKRLDDGTEQEKTYKYKVAYDFEAGCQYHYQLTLGKAGVITIASVTVEAWGSTTNVDEDASVPDDLVDD